jgi:hypothetical protein
MNTVYQSHLSACTPLTAGPNNSQTCSYQIPLAWYKPQLLFHLTQLWLAKPASNILYNQHNPMCSIHRHGKWSPVSLTCTSQRYACLTKAVRHASSQAISCQPLNTKICSQTRSCRIFTRQSGNVTEFSPKYFGFRLAQSSHNAPYSLTHLSRMPHDLSKWL